MRLLLLTLLTATLYAQTKVHPRQIRNWRQVAGPGPRAYTTIAPEQIVVDLRRVWKEFAGASEIRVLPYVPWYRRIVAPGVVTEFPGGLMTGTADYFLKTPAGDVFRNGPYKLLYVDGVGFCAGICPITSLPYWP